jgi:hypothetical protein
VSECTIEFRTTDWSESDDEGRESKKDEDETMDWVTIVYDFKLIKHYTPIVVMFEVSERETFKFWITMDYLQFEGDIQT